ncbi:DUF2279 domain-containing protein [Bacteroidota bacterium]
MQKKFYICIFLLIVLVYIKPSFAQEQRYNFPDTLNKKRLTALTVTIGASYLAGMVGLYHLWYKGYDQSSFHLFNDNDGWMQIDKLGHTTTAYTIGRLGYLAFRWTGMNEKKSIWIGGSLGFFFLTTVEIFDGFSQEWGASTGDIIANAAGSMLFISQQLLWKKQKIMMKYSFHTTKYAQYNPEQLGENFIQQALKDYNGHTYWLSFNIKSFAFKNSKLPKWLSLSVGYGAKGMIGAGSNPTEIDGKPIPHYNRTRQYFFAPEIDLSRIQTKSDFWNGFLDVIGFIKFPLPALEYNKEDNFKFHWIYF